MSIDKPVISFRANVAGAFGLVLRSSAIFYYRSTADFCTTISFMNYWKVKRSLDVAVVASTRDMVGRLLLRERVPLTAHSVINYRPAVDREVFEGSVEIEIFSTANLVIPYAAVMAVYESARGIAAVHSYARAYSRHEVEDGRMISSGREGCWSLRDNETVGSFCVFHNGPGRMPPQISQLRVSNSSGESGEAAIELPELMPYRSVMIRPKDHIPGLAEFLAGDIGEASLSFSLGDGFTRMLVGNERHDGSDLQVTHSNFDYANQATDHLDDPTQRAFMRVPSCGLGGKKVIVYPHSSPGHYAVEHGATCRSFASGETVVEPVAEAQDLLAFRRSDGPFPARLVTGMIVPNREGLVDNECSLGVLTHLQPRKRFWWGICAADDRRASALILHDVPEIYGGMPRDGTATIDLYSSTGREPLSAQLDRRDIERMDVGVTIDELIPGARQHLNGDFGYYTLFHEYGGLTAYTLFDNKAGGKALEHAF
jgi:hypothetical protein